MPLVGFFVMLIITVFYWNIQYNYFYMDDFHWISRAITAQNSFAGIFSIEGRDFNPVFLAILSLIIKICGPSVPVLRLFTLLSFAAAITAFFYVLWHHFKVHPVIAISAALCTALNVFVSEAVLNLAALVYPLSLLFALLAIKFYWDDKKWLYLLFMVLAFFTKETAVLIILPLFLYEKEKTRRLFLAVSGLAFIAIRITLQWGATASYTGFMETENLGYKFYFILLRSMNLSPYSIPLSTGIIIVVVLFLIGGYFLFVKKERGFLFFLFCYGFFALFFALLPKLSSRYLLFPSIGFWGIAALLAHYFYSVKKNRVLLYAFISFLLVVLLFNYPVVQREIEDYKILGDFSKEFVQKEGNHIKGLLKNLQPTEKSGPVEIAIYKGDHHRLAEMYRHIQWRNNLPKLLPFREHSIGGVIEPKHLLPLIFYPQRAEWKTVLEDTTSFKGKIMLAGE